MNNTSFQYDYGQQPASSSKPDNSQPPNSTAFIHSDSSEDYTIRWIEYFRSVGEYSKALDLEKKLTADKGPRSYRCVLETHESNGKAHRNVATYVENERKNFEKSISHSSTGNNIMLTGKSVDMNFTYNLMSYSAQAESGIGPKSWQEVKKIGGMKRKGDQNEVLIPGQGKKVFDIDSSINTSDYGVGKKLLQRMGWRPGQSLGKNGDGLTNPLRMEMKLDRRGLMTDEDKQVSRKEKEVLVNGKHPVGYVNELCDRRRWKYPEFTCIELGPQHNKRFMWKATLNDVEYSLSVPSANKKAGKAQVCVVILQALGLVKIE